MPGWPTAPSPTSALSAATPALLAWRIGSALALGLAVAALYRWARRGEAAAPTFLTTLVLLATVIAIATQVIGDNLARAFSLIGGLSVVRFRTVVKDTQDTAFVILAVVMGMAAGAGQLTVALVGLAIVAAASAFLWPGAGANGGRGLEGTLSVRVSAGEGVRQAVESVLSASTDRLALQSAATARKGANLDFTYRVRLRPGVSPADLVARLVLVEGVESADLGRAE